MNIISSNPTRTVGIYTDPLQKPYYLGQFNSADFTEMAKQIAGVFGDSVVDLEVRKGHDGSYALFVSDGRVDPYVVMVVCKARIWTDKI